MDLEETDSSLLERLGRGEMDALEVILQRCGRRVWAYVYRNTNSGDTADDVTQETFLRLCRIAGRYRKLGPRDSILPLLIRMATNVAFNIREHEARGEKMKAGYLSQLATRVEEPDQSVLAKEAAAKLNDAVGKMPPKYRVPFVLYEMEAWSYEQIAKYCDVSLGTVKSRIWRGRELLRGYLESYWKG